MCCTFNLQVCDIDVNHVLASIYIKLALCLVPLLSHAPPPELLYHLSLQISVNCRDLEFALLHCKRVEGVSVFLSFENVLGNNENVLQNNTSDDFNKKEDRQLELKNPA